MNNVQQAQETWWFGQYLSVWNPFLKPGWEWMKPTHLLGGNEYVALPAKMSSERFTVFVALDTPPRCIMKSLHQKRGGSKEYQTTFKWFKRSFLQVARRSVSWFLQRIGDVHSASFCQKQSHIFFTKWLIHNVRMTIVHTSAKYGLKLCSKKIKLVCSWYVLVNGIASHWANAAILKIECFIHHRSQTADRIWQEAYVRCKMAPKATSAEAAKSPMPISPGIQEFDPSKRSAAQCSASFFYGNDQYISVYYAFKSFSTGASSTVMFKDVQRC